MLAMQDMERFGSQLIQQNPPAGAELGEAADVDKRRDSRPLLPGETGGWGGGKCRETDDERG